MEEIIDTNTGEVNVSGGKITLRSVAIGSCVVIAAYDCNRKIGGMAHIMLPGSAPKNAAQKTRYAENALDEMVSKMVLAGAGKNDIAVCLVGGGNVLKRKDDTICEANIKSVIETLEKRGITVKAEALGGTMRKSVSLDVESGAFYYTEGDGSQRLLWKPEIQ